MTSSITSFSYHNPTAIEFGWGALARLPELVNTMLAFSRLEAGGRRRAPGPRACPARAGPARSQA